LSILGDAIDIREIHLIGQMGSNISEADVRSAITANQNSIPPFFKGTSKTFTGDSVGAKHWLKGIPAYGFWGKPGSVDGYKYWALNQLDHIISAIHTDLNCRVQNSELRGGFLKAMLTRSQEFVRSLVDYIVNSYYTELNESFTESDQTWDFVCHCVEQLFSHEFNVASSVLWGHDLKASGFNEQMLWKSLRSVVVQESFLAVLGISNHSSLLQRWKEILDHHLLASRVIAEDSFSCYVEKTWRNRGLSTR